MNEPLVRLAGADFVGGAKERFGASQNGRHAVNYVYARSTGEASVLRARFELPRIPPGALYLFVEAMDDDYPSRCRVEIRLNEIALATGDTGFPDAAWDVRRFPIPAGALKAGGNEIAIACLEERGALGMPPWFMVAAAAVAAAGYRMPRPPWPAFPVRLPAAKRPLPTPRSSGDPPGFALRGAKGWQWSAEQYRAEAPTLAAHGMNFLMNCYSSMGDIERVPWGSPDCNRWWEPLPETKKRDYEAVVRECQRRRIDFCFSLNPNLSSRRYADPAKSEDVEALWRHYAWMQGLGIRWFNLSLDDIGQGIDGGMQARLTNEIFRRLRATDPAAQMVFCPTFYWGDASDRAARTYLVDLGAALHPEIYCFWTGDAVVTPRITRKAAVRYREAIRHRLILWDNYPVNDGAPTLHLGPVTGRDPDLPAVIEGYLSNPLFPQNEINRLPLLTCAEYAANPARYDPDRAIGQAIWHLTENRMQREALRELVEAYPGMLRFSQGTGFNPVRARFGGLGTADERARDRSRQERLLRRLEKAFPGRFGDAKKSVSADLEWMRAKERP